MNNKNWLVFLETNETEWEDFYFYFEKNDNNILAFDIIKNLLEWWEDYYNILPEFEWTQEDINKFPDRNTYMKKFNVIEGDLDIDKLRKIEEIWFSHEFYKWQIRNYIKK